jgi:hypothetical protein
MTLTTQYFDSFDQWVNRASSWLTCHSDYNDGSVTHYDRFTAICFDTEGRICRIGADFMRARDEGTFPVRWIWPDQVPELALAALGAPSADRPAWLSPEREASGGGFDGPTGAD